MKINKTTEIDNTVELIGVFDIDEMIGIVDIVEKTAKLER